MTRLQSELTRLYEPFIDLDGGVKSMMLSVAQPADWGALAVVWAAVQSDLSLPAPAIAVSGLDAYQLWFSLEEAVPMAEAQGFLLALRDQYLGDLEPDRVRWLPALAAMTGVSPWPDGVLPGRAVQAGQWSAFVAPDLAPIFADTPWLDIPPNPEGQADLLSRLQSISPKAWHGARQRLMPVRAPERPALPKAAEASGAGLEAHHFLLSVMNDEAAPLALRIEAAKALLDHAKP